MLGKLAKGIQSSSLPDANRLLWLFEAGISAGATLFAVLLLSQRIVIADPWLSAIVTSVVLFGLPGFFLAGILFAARELDLLEKVAFAGALSISMLLVTAIVHLFLRTEMATLSRSLTILYGVLAIAYIGSRRKAYNSSSRSRLSLRAPSAATLSMIILFGAALILLFVFFSRTNTVWRYGDRWLYIPVIRHLLEAPRLGITDIYVGVNPMGPRHQFAAWWVIQALFCRISGIAPADVISTFIYPALMVISVLSFYALSKGLSKRTNLALLAAVIQIVYYLSDIAGPDALGRGMVGYSFFGRLGEDKAVVAFVLVPIAVSAAARFVARGRRPWAGAFLLITIGIALNHPQGMAFLGLSVGTYLCVHLFFRRERQTLIRIALVLVIMALCMSVPAYQLVGRLNYVGSLSASSEEALEESGQFQDAKLLTLSEENNLYVASPTLVMHPLMVISLLCSLLSIYRIKRHSTAQFIFSNLILVPAVLYNPVTASALAAVVTPTLLWRVLWFLPIGLPISYAFYVVGPHLARALGRASARLYPRIRKSSGSSNDLPASVGTASGILLPWVLVWALLVSQSGRIRDGLDVFAEQKATSATSQERNFLDQAGSFIEPGSYVLIDPYLNDLLPAFVDARVLYFWGVQPYADNARRDVRMFFGTEVDKDVVRVLNEYDVVKYVILARELNPALITQFDQMSPTFRRLYDDDAFVLYEVTPDRTTRAGEEIVWGSYHLLKGDQRKAEHFFLLSLKHAQLSGNGSNLPLAYVGLGNSYLSQGLADDAVAAYQEAVVDPRLASLANIGLGDAFSHRGNLEEAAAAYGQVPDSDPYKSVARAGELQVLGEIYKQEGRTLDAVEAFEKASYCDSAEALLGEQPATADPHATTLLETLASVSGNPVEVKTFAAEGTRRVVLFQHPPSEARFPLLVPPSSTLRFSTALSAEVWQLGKGDGVQFDIYLEDSDHTWHLFSEYIDPKNLPDDRRWHDHDLDLSSWAGEPVTLTLVTDPGPNGDDRYDWAGWGDPRIIEDPAYDFLAELPAADYRGAGETGARQDLLTIDCEPRDVLLQPPSSRITYAVDVPERGAALRFGIGMDPAVWASEQGEAMEFRIYVRQPDQPKKLYKVFGYHLDPKNNRSDRHWLDQMVDLSDYGGQEVDIIFETRPGSAEGRRLGWGVWSAPVLVGDDMALTTPDGQE